jgi:4-hydroxybenzoyl-CoA thioesterase
MKTYKHNVTVHWGHTDPAKIVFYPNYFIWFDQTTRLLFDSVGLDWDTLMEKYGVLGVPLVEASSKFRAPCKFRDEIVVESGVTAWSEKTFEMKHTITNRGVLSVEGREVRAWVKPHPDDPSRIKAFEIPDEVRRAFE